MATPETSSQPILTFRNVARTVGGVGGGLLAITTGAHSTVEVGAWIAIGVSVAEGAISLGNGVRSAFTPRSTSTTLEG